MLKNLFKNILLLASLTFVIITFLIYFLLKEIAYSYAFTNIQDTLMNVKALRHFVSSEQKTEVYKLQNDYNISKDFFKPQLLSSTFSAQAVNKYYNEIRIKSGLEPIILRFASNNPRNIKNQANQYESRILEKFNKKVIHDFTQIKYNDDGKKILYYALPSRPLEKKCMKCHSEPQMAPKGLIDIYGDKNGFHEKLGSTRALISTEYPLEKTDLFIYKTTFVLSVLTLIILSLFVVFYKKFSNQILLKNEELQELNNSLEDKVKEETKALLQTNKELHNFIIGSDLGYWNWNLKTGKHIVNNRWCSIIGITQNDLEGTQSDWEERIHPDDLKKIIPIIQDAFEHDSPYTVEFRMLHKNGTYVWIEGSGSIIEKDINGEALRACGTHKDISSRKETELKLIKTNNELIIFKKIIDTVKVGASLTQYDKQTNEHRVIYTNDTFTTITGYSKAEVKGKDLKFLQNDDKKQEAIKIISKALKNNKSCGVEIRNYKKDGTLFYNYLTLTPIYNNNGIVENYIGIQNDITEYKENENKLAQQNKLASLGEMLTNIAHQWRQPLSAISTVATGLEMKQEYNLLNEESLQSGLSTINDNVQYLSQTIDDFRNFLSDDSLKSLYSIDELSTNFLKLVADSSKQNNINIILNTHTNITIYGYKNELLQCFMNIFHNAKDVFQERDIENKLLLINYTLQNDTLKIEFKDNAGGIDMDIIDKIFEPYFTTKHKAKGTGIGLDITRKLIHMLMEGSIEVKNTHFTYESQEYKGAHFIILLPIK